MSQVQDLENCIFELAKDENLLASEAEQHFKNVCKCLEWDEETIDKHADSLFDRVHDWYEWCQSLAAIYKSDKE